MIKKLFLSDVGVACDHKDYRKLLAANFTIIANVIIGLAFIGSFAVVYLSRAADYPLYGHLYFSSMLRFFLGHKKGLISSAILFSSIYPPFPKIHPYNS